VSTQAQSFVGTVAAPEFPPDVEWLNTGRPLSLAELRGKVVLLDFWTYGCINCMHVIPDLKRLEQKYPDELVVIGVHSAKFTNEGDSDNIRQIIRRYELEHPIINDNEFAVWSTYGVNAWPTFVLIDPDGLVLGFHSGEGIYELFDFVIAGMIKEFGAKGRLDRTPLDIILEHEGLADSPLLFPGKVLADEANGRLFIADSNHNRIVITDLEGLVLDVIGSGLAGRQDGGFATAAFFRPQGLTLADDNTLYVADTENHTLRRLDLASRLVTTVAGTGEQGRYQQFEGHGLEVALNSPWEVLVHEGLIYIAMAGQHQLWLYEPATEVVRAFAGSGREELKDGLLEEGGLNQPSGLATDGRRLYFADSEASAIRYVDLARGTLHTIVGTGLFDFGDVDGVGDMVRLQHPLGLVYRNGLLYVADTYNSKIKVVKPETRESSSFLGGSVAGWQDGHQALFDEPGGLSLAGDKLYIADTNNHAIRVADLTRREVSTLVLVDRAGLLTRQPEGAAYTGKIITVDPQTVAAGEGVIRLQLDLPDGYKLNELAPLSVEWSGQDGVEVAEARYQAIAPKLPVTVPAVFHEGETKLTADLVVRYCKAAAESLCLIERVRLLLPLVVTAEGDSTLAISHTIPQPPTVNH
jgi:thiol-disulfide isomerase/thioredoxin